MLSRFKYSVGKCRVYIRELEIKNRIYRIKRKILKLKRKKIKPLVSKEANSYMKSAL